MRSVDHHISALATVEIRSALRRLESSGEISSVSASDALGWLEAELLHLQVAPLSAAVLASAQRVIDTHRLRTLDALQLGTALLLTETDLLSALTFVAADRQLLAAAHRSGLRTLNPELPA